MYEFSTSTSITRGAEEEYKEVLWQLDRVVMKNVPGDNKLRVNELVEYVNQRNNREGAYGFDSIKEIE